MSQNLLEEGLDIFSLPEEKLKEKNPTQHKIFYGQETIGERYLK